MLKKNVCLTWKIYSYVLRELSELYLNITYICNLHCAYCIVAHRIEDNRYLSLDDYKNLLDQAAKINPEMNIILTGGEPLTSDLTIPVARYARELGFTCPMLTNGILIDKNNVDYLDSVVKGYYTTYTCNKFGLLQCMRWSFWHIWSLFLANVSTLKYFSQDHNGFLRFLLYTLVFFLRLFFGAIAIITAICKQILLVTLKSTGIPNASTAKGKSLQGAPVL